MQEIMPSSSGPGRPVRKAGYMGSNPIGMILSGGKALVGASRVATIQTLAKREFGRMGARTFFVTGSLPLSFNGQDTGLLTRLREFDSRRRLL